LSADIAPIPVSPAGPAIDSAIVDTLEDALAEARRGELSSVAIIRHSVFPSESGGLN
jgi:hypothetical protein